MADNVHIFGIRHHGPGSARSLRLALEQLAPDCVLVEGPPDAADILPLAAAEGMKPPTAILVYAADRPRLAVYYPFAEFSPEWQAIQYALTKSVPLRFMDLPQTHRLAMEMPPAQEDEPADGDDDAAANPAQAACDAPGVDTAQPPQPAAPAEDFRRDPLAALANACGYNDSERWWDHMIESRQDGTDLFAAILEAMTALREQELASPAQADASSPAGVPATAPGLHEHEESLREAYMRQTLRAAQKEGFARIAVVCGAWHTPALATLGPTSKDAALLKGLPKIKVSCTWVPWTYNRLTFASGYGAGVVSPGWYEHLWRVRRSGMGSTDSSIRWLTRVARFLREKDFDVSSAHIIEAVRLAESLAAMRGRPLPGLDEFSEACRSIFCFGDSLPLGLVHQRLIVGTRMGQVPESTPTVPLQQDLERLQKRLRLPAKPLDKVYDLDLRNATDLERSQLVHRLGLLGVQWGRREEVRGKSGTFHEVWTLQWQPELTVALIEASTWGNTVQDAATAFACDRADKAAILPQLTQQLEVVLLADLPVASARLTQRLSDLSAVTSDIGHLMDAIGPLARVLRYGNVRQTDASMVAHVVDALVARICIGLGGACSQLNDEAAAEMLARVEAVHAAITLLQNASHQEIWTATLTRLADLPNLHGLLAGRFCRLLLDGGSFTADEASGRMSLALSLAADPAAEAAWIEGFLRGSGLVLLHDTSLWAVLDQWVTQLHADAFTQLLPLLRRTFAQFNPAERRQIGQRAKSDARTGAAAGSTGGDELDEARAVKVLPVLERLLGLQVQGAT